MCHSAGLGCLPFLAAVLSEAAFMLMATAFAECQHVLQLAWSGLPSFIDSYLISGCFYGNSFFWALGCDRSYIVWAAFLLMAALSSAFMLMAAVVAGR